MKASNHQYKNGAFVPVWDEQPRLHKLLRFIGMAVVIGCLVTISGFIWAWGFKYA